MTEYLKALAEPFPPEAVHWRVGSTTQDKSKGMALAYIDARDVMNRLDDVCGPTNWQTQYSHAGAKTICELSIRVDGEWLVKSDGAGDTDYEGEKGAISSALKRAGVLWGIGRYLYDLKAPWVEIMPAGKSFKIKQSEMPKLQRLLGTDPSNMPTANLKPLSQTRRAVDLSAFEATAESDVEFREEVSHMIRGAKSVTEVENIYRANKERLHEYSGAFAADHRALMGEFERRKGDLSQKPKEAA